MSYILDMSKLQLGDIVISSGTSLGAQFIKIGTLSKDTHAMLYTDHTMIHAVPDGGVFSKNPQRELFKSEEHVRVLRLKERIPHELLELICDYARSLVGAIYSVKEAIRTKKSAKTLDGAKTNMQFCSRLIAQSYASQNISLVNNVNYCSPKELGNSTLLQEAIGCVRKASQEDIAFAKSPDPTVENQRRTYEWLNKTRDIAKKLDFNVQAINDVSTFLQHYPKNDTSVCDFIKKSGYLEHYNVDLNLNPHRYDDKLFTEYFKEKQIPLEEAVKGEFQKEPGLINHMNKNYQVHSQMYASTNLEYHAIHVKLYQDILLFVKSRLIVLYQVFTTSIDTKFKAQLFLLIQQIEQIVI